MHSQNIDLHDKRDEPVLNVPLRLAFYFAFSLSNFQIVAFYYFLRALHKTSHGKLNYN
jgi:hypothetical protein